LENAYIRNGISGRSKKSCWTKHKFSVCEELEESDLREVDITLGKGVTN